MRILQCFLSADMRCGHDGLKDIAKKSKIDCDKLDDGTYVVFVNSEKNRMKLFAPNHVVAYYKCRPGERLALETIPLILKSFNASGRIDYDKALRETIEKALTRRAQ
jgi:hypothetical protein